MHELDTSIQISRCKTFVLTPINSVPSKADKANGKGNVIDMILVCQSCRFRLYYSTFAIHIPVKVQPFKTERKNQNHRYIHT